MSSELKQLISQYNTVQQEAQKLPMLKKRLIEMLKRENLTNSKFNFGSHTLKYHKYTRPGQITQKSIELYIAEHYPSLDAQSVASSIAAQRPKFTTETIKIDK